PRPEPHGGKGARRDDLCAFERRRRLILLPHRRRPTMNKLAFCFVTLGIASLTCAQAAPSRPGQAPSPRGGDDLQSELKQLHRELRQLRALVDQMPKEAK